MSDTVTQTTKIRVRNIASVAIIYRRSRPDQFLMEIKDQGYPVPLYRNCLNFPGGNFMGEAAKNDGNPLGTLRREIGEEFTLDRKPQSTEELRQLGLIESAETFIAPHNDREPSIGDRTMLETLTRAILKSPSSFGDFIIRTPKAVLDASDPNNKREEMSAVASYWDVPLDEEAWSLALELQHRFGNFSAESITTVTSLPAIIGNKARIAFGHDRPFQHFLRAKGIKGAADLPLIEGLLCEPMGGSLSSYQEYLDRYEVATLPPGF